MSLPDNKIKQIAVPAGGGTATYDIIPEKLQNSGFSADLPTLTGNSILVTTNDLVTTSYDSANLSLVIGNNISDKNVSIEDAQTISGKKTFTSGIQTDEIDNTSGQPLVRYNGKNVFGGSNYGCTLMGNEDRPRYSKDGSNFAGSELALTTDLNLIIQSNDATDMLDHSPFTFIRIFRGSLIVSGKFICYSSSSLSRIYIDSLANCETLQYAFENCYNLQEVLGDPSIEKCTNLNQVFNNCIHLKRITFKNIKVSFNISMSTAFEESDLVEIISNLDTVTSTQTLTMGSTNLAKLTDAEKKVATDKGWTLA